MAAEYMSVKDASIYLSICIRTLRSKISDHVIPVYVHVSKYLLKRSDLDNYMSQFRVEAIG